VTPTRHPARSAFASPVLGSGRTVTDPNPPRARCPGVPLARALSGASGAGAAPTARLGRQGCVRPYGWPAVEAGGAIVAPPAWAAVSPRAPPRQPRGHGRGARGSPLWTTGTASRRAPKPRPLTQAQPHDPMICVDGSNCPLRCVGTLSAFSRNPCPPSSESAPHSREPKNLPAGHDRRNQRPDTRQRRPPVAFPGLQATEHGAREPRCVAGLGARRQRHPSRKRPLLRQDNSGFESCFRETWDGCARSVQRPSFDEICTKKPSGSLRLTVEPPVLA
jgi:hypothetical protein